MINVELKQRYGLDADKMARFIISDTAAAVRKVSKQFDNSLQTDCVMHVLSLCIGYGIGLKENTKSEWELVVQMEVVMQRIADLALVESQSATMISSTMYVLLRVTSARMNSYRFSAYSLKGTRTADTNEKNFPRFPLTLPDLCDLAQRCIMRTLHQIASRLPEPSVAIEAATEKILTTAKEGLRTEHRVMYKALFAIDSCEEETSTSTSRSPSGDCNSSSDTELDLLCGEEVTQSTEESVADADATLNAKADERLEQWLNLRIESDQVAKHQYSDKKECEMVLSHLTIRNRRHRNVRVWNIEQLCQQINVRQWLLSLDKQGSLPLLNLLVSGWGGAALLHSKSVYSRPELSL
ncbi:hypothetical protein PHPALM_31970 [Phytophthora palmivora]|uniref:Uncharacterized protein n=1 Tax=Phytophthora palmivora TaxID=4796 RepID=A0A2P4X193_9STRA|nr:hypothetical protein PHPALM_31970 [Phytophthora palmivora]